MCNLKPYDVVKLTWTERGGSNDEVTYKTLTRENVIVLQRADEVLTRYRFLYRDGNQTYLKWLPANNFTAIEKTGTLNSYPEVGADIADYALDENWEVRRVAKRLAEELKRLEKNNEEI